MEDPKALEVPPVEGAKGDAPVLDGPKEIKGDSPVMDIKKVLKG